MAFMELCIYEKAQTFTKDCDHCGASNYWHPATGEHIRVWQDDGICNHCGAVMPCGAGEDAGMLYAGRYSAPGYMDCTDWHFSPNKRELVRELRETYAAD